MQSLFNFHLSYSIQNRTACFKAIPLGIVSCWVERTYAAPGISEILLL